MIVPVASVLPLHPAVLVTKFSAQPRALLTKQQYDKSRRQAYPDCSHYSLFELIAGAAQCPYTSWLSCAQKRRLRPADKNIWVGAYMAASVIQQGSKYSAPQSGHLSVRGNQAGPGYRPTALLCEMVMRSKKSTHRLTT